MVDRDKRGCCMVYCKNVRGGLLFVYSYSAFLQPCFKKVEVGLESRVLQSGTEECLAMG